MFSIPVDATDFNNVCNMIINYSFLKYPKKYNCQCIIQIPSSV